jgi:hypothetical protein
MAISRISSADSSNTTVAIGTHAKGDLILMFAYRDNSTSAITLPAGWVSQHQSGSASHYAIAAWKLAETASETSGTWTNASHLVCIVLRGGSGSIVLPRFMTVGTSTGATTHSFSAQTVNTFPTNSTDYALIGWHANRSSANSLEIKAPTGMTNISSATDGSNWQVAWHEQLARTTVWTTTNVTVANSVAYRTYVIDVVEVPFNYSSGGSSSFRPVNIRGGADQ